MEKILSTLAGERAVKTAINWLAREGTQTIELKFYLRMAWLFVNRSRPRWLLTCLLCPTRYHVPWFARNAEASKAHDAIFLGNMVGYVLWTILVAITMLTPGAQPADWIAVVIYLHLRQVQA
jgi:hypothetical protein